MVQMEEASDGSMVIGDVVFGVAPRGRPVVMTPIVSEKKRKKD
jgi:hypothetical protein